jgi:cytochrome c oxidase cbb3-type subunit III
MKKRPILYLKNTFGAVLFLFFFIPTSKLFGQDTAKIASPEPSLFGNMDPMTTLILLLVTVVMILVIITLGIMINLARLMLFETEKARALATGQEYVQPLGFIEGWWNKVKEKWITGKLYSEKQEKENMLLDHNYDGIQEMDYSMPPWLSSFFLITIGFGVIYMINIYGFGVIPGQEEEYAQEVEQAEMAIAEWKSTQADMVDENTVEFSEDPAILSRGKEIYMKECILCHGEFGEGGIGPNMTDDYWLHGGSMKDMFKLIKYGVPDKGMISWQKKLTPADMAAVATFIYTLHGTNPSNPKDPQGEIYMREDAVPTQEVEIQPGEESIDKGSES